MGPWWHRFLRATVFAFGATLAQAASAADFHAIFEDRCLGCHGHAGPFVSGRLTLDNGQVVGANGQPIGDFLTTHAGGLDAPTRALFLWTFRNQIESGSLYRAKCITCHDRAYEFVRLNLALDDDRLVGRYSDRVVAEFLRSHGRLTPDEQQVMLTTLRAFLDQAPQAPPPATVDSDAPTR